PRSFGTPGDAGPATGGAASPVKGRATAGSGAGRRDQCRSPSGQRSGTRKRNVNAKSGSPTMTTASVAGGISARIAKYPRKYQSGRGSATTFVGSAGLLRSGAPRIAASNTTAATTAAAVTASRQAESGQKGIPRRSISA